MQLNDLDFSYPDHLIATEKHFPSRVMWVDADHSPQEMTVEELLRQFRAGDVLVVNNTRVLKRRVFASNGLEVLFLEPLSPVRWQVLFPASRVSEQQAVALPGGLSMRLVERGRPQVVELSEAIGEDYFVRHGELALPPYIQKARGERHARATDDQRYQTQWATVPGSFAAPTASLHFGQDHLSELRALGVGVFELTLHVGLGTFLPVQGDLDSHVMHAEWLEVPGATWQAVQAAIHNGHRVWALGTTVTRALESQARGLLGEAKADGSYQGLSDLFIRPPFDFKVVSMLMTNFHQPQSTLLALVASFAGLDQVKRCYQWAIEREFRLFSYGDLSVWVKKSVNLTS